MDKLTKIVFKVTSKTYGLPYPSIKDKTVLIIVQNGDVEFGMYHEPNSKTPYPSFSHPKNAKEVKLLGQRIIKNENPEYLNSDLTLQFICPEEYLHNLMWENHD